MATSSFGQPLVIKDPELAKKIRAELNDPNPERYQMNPKHHVPTFDEIEEASKRWLKK